MTTYILCWAAGMKVGLRLAEELGAELVPISSLGVREAFESRWQGAEAFILVGALAIAVRGASNLLGDKATDPAVVVVSEDGGVALPVCSGHLGGATDLARSAAAALADYDCQFIATTASDRAGFVAPDLWATRRGYSLLFRSGMAALIRKLLDEGEINVFIDPLLTDRGVSLPLPAGYRSVTQAEDADLFISPRQTQRAVGAKPQIVPRVLVLGIGCRAAVRPEEIERGLAEALSRHQSGPFLSEALLHAYTSCRKENESGLIEACREMGLPLSFLSDEEILAEGDCFSESAATRWFGLPGVAEPCASSAGELLGPRVLLDKMTVAIAVAPPQERGMLSVVGSGPGRASYITKEARETLLASDVIVGYGLYVDLLPKAWLAGKVTLRYGMGEEEMRADEALSYAERGYRVSLVCGGDPILFGLAALALQKALQRGIDCRIVPGITAIQAAGARIGAPYANGLILLSLSDYLQPWPDVVQAMEGAAASGLSVALYNPVKRDLEQKLSSVRRIFAGRRALLLRDAGREDESVRELASDLLQADEIDMRTMIFFPSAKTEAHCCDGTKHIWLEKRGYRTELSEGQEISQLGQFLVLGGTTEGRNAALALLEAGMIVTTSVARKEGQATVPEGSPFIQGQRRSEGWQRLFSGLSSPLCGVIDATHPFAVEASREIADACEKCGLPLLRFLRPDESVPGAIYAASVTDACQRAIEETEEGDLVFLTVGVRMLDAILPQLRGAGRRVCARVLSTEESMRLACQAGLDPRETVGIWGRSGSDFDEAIFRAKGARVIMTKASGEAGGLKDKAKAAMRLGIPIVVISRPAGPQGIETVNGTEGLVQWAKSQL